MGAERSDARARAERAGEAAGGPELDQRLGVQAAAGNLAASSVLAAAGGAPVQAKLTVGGADDPWERAADDAADRALERLGSGEDAPPAVAPGAPPVQRLATGGEGGVGRAGGQLDGGTERAIAGTTGGQPLPDRVRARMEHAFDADFGGVRVHDGRRADGLARGINAEAFTTGSQLFFRSGRFDPSSRDGERLLAHELAHVVQQGAAPTTRPVRRAPRKVQRLFGIGEARSGRTDLDTEQIPGAFVELVDTIQKMDMAKDLSEQGKDFDFANLENPLNNMANKATGTTMVGAVGAKDMITGGMTFGEGIRNVTRQGASSLEKNLGAQQIEGGTTKFLTGGNNIVMDSMDKYGGLASANPIADFAQAGIKGKKAIEEGVTAEKLRHEGKRIKHDRDHFLPLNARVDRLEAFRKVYKRYKDAQELKGQKTTALVDKRKDLTAALESLATLEKGAGTAQSELKKAQQELEQAQAAKRKLDEQQTKYDEQQAKKSAPQKKPGFFDKLSKLAAPKEITAPTAKQKTDAQAAITTADDTRKTKQSGVDKATSDVTAQKQVVTNLKKDVADLEKDIAAAEKAMSKAKGEMKRDDLERFEDTLTKKSFDWKQPCAATDQAVVDFLEHCQKTRIKEFGKGTEFRKQGTTGASGEYDQLGHLQEFGQFARGRKIQQSTFNAVEATGHTLDAVGTFTAGADFGGTKIAGKTLKAGAAVGKSGWSGFKRARRVHRLRQAKNETAYGGKSDRGVLWGAKVFFGGNVDESQKKLKKVIKDTGAGNKSATTVKKGVDLTGKSQDDVKRLVTSITIKCKRQITQFMHCLASEKDVVRTRAKETYRIIVETNLSGALAKVEDSDLETFARLVKEEKAGTLSTADQTKLKRMRRAIKDSLHLHLDGIGG